MDIAIINYFGLAAFVLALVVQIFWRAKAVKMARLIVVSSIGGVAIALIIYSISLYFFWQASPVARGLLPPYAPITYFLGFILARFWGQYILSLIVAAIIGWSAYKLNLKFGNQFLEDEEPYFIFLALFFIGHPFWILYFIGAPIINLLAIIVMYLMGHRGKVSFYYIWLSVAIVLILVAGPNPIITLPCLTGLGLGAQCLPDLLKSWYFNFKI